MNYLEVMVMGRNAQPIDLMLVKGAKHLTKAEIDHRKKTEIKTGDCRLRCPTFVKNDVVAYAKWKEIIKVYKDINFVSSGDTGLLARYCVTFSEYLTLLDQKRRIQNFEVNYERLSEQFDPELLEGMDSFFKFDPVMKLDGAVNKKMDMLIKMEDRMFLNPLSKIKNIPKKAEKEVDPNADFFD
jgi:phage terminase small subunit